MSPRLASCLALIALSACQPGSGDATADASSTGAAESTSSTGPDPDTTASNPTTGGATTDVDTTGAPATDPSTTTGDPTADPSTTGVDPDACFGTAECDGGFCWFEWAGTPPARDDFTCHDVCVDDMGSGNAEVAWCLDDAACCSPDVTCDPMGYCVAPSDTDTDTDTDGETGEFAAMLAITGLTVTANCMPAIPQDPVQAAWSLDIDNTLGLADVTATVFKSSLVYTPGMDEFVQAIKVAPTALGPTPAGMITSTPMSKTGAINNLPDDCSRCGNMVRLDLTFKIDGAEVPVTAEATMECVF